MRQQVIDGDRVTEVRHLGNVLADVVGQRQAAILDEKQNGRGDELLSDRAGVQERVRGQRTLRSRSASPYAR